jgi:hypothetical protein
MIVGNYTYTTVTAGTGDEAGLAAAAGLRLMGLSVRETAGAVATLNVEHGTANSSPIMDAINLAAAGTVTHWFGPQGLPCAGGIWIERLTGTTQVNLITTIDG